MFVEKEKKNYRTDLATKLQIKFVCFWIFLKNLFKCWNIQKKKSVGNPTSFAITAVFPQFFTHCAIFNFSAQDVTYITCQAGIRSCKLIAKSLISQKKGGKYESWLLLFFT